MKPLNIFFFSSRTLKQEDSMSGDPCSPSSHLSSSTPSSHCSSRPASPMVPTTQRPTNSIDFGRITDLETDFLPEDCIDGSEFDQYLPPGAVNPQLYHGQYLKHTEESNNNIHKNLRHYNPEAILPDGEYNCTESLVRYHELQPSNSLVKNERFAPAHGYTYQNGMSSLPSASGYNGSSYGQYLPSYQYMPPQRTVFPNSGSYVVNGVSAPTTNDNWSNYV